MTAKNSMWPRLLTVAVGAHESKKSGWDLVKINETLTRNEMLIKAALAKIQRCDVCYK